MKRVTRRHVRAWLSPIRACFNQMKTGEVDSIRGYAVTKLRGDDDYARIDYCIAGFRGMISRVLAYVDDAPLLALEKKLAAGTPITPAEIEAAMVFLAGCEDKLVGVPRTSVLDAVTTEQIAIEFQQMGVL